MMKMPDHCCGVGVKGQRSCVPYTVKASSMGWVIRLAAVVKKRRRPL